MNTSRRTDTSRVEISPRKRADQIRRAQQSGGGARAIIAPTNGYRGELARQGKVVKNHAKENRLALKQMTISNNVKEANKTNQATKKLSKMKQFQNVPSKIFQSKDDNNNYEIPQEQQQSIFNLNKSSSQQSQVNVAFDDSIPMNSSTTFSPQKQTNFLKKKSGGYVNSETKARENLERERRGEVPLVSPRLEERRSVAQQRARGGIPKQQGILKQRESKNYLQMNKSEQMGSRPPEQVLQKSNSSPQQERHDNYGNVPNYIQKRKQKWAEEERQRILNAPDVDCPEGMICMPESERLETLEVLDRSEEEAKRELFALPLSVTTLAATRRKNGLEAKLKEIEDAKKIFSREKVYISM